MRRNCFLIGCILVLAGSDVWGYELQKRRSYHISLPLITVLFDGNNTFEEAFVTFDNTGEGWALGTVNDRYVKDTRKERVDHFYREMATSAHYLTTFESQLLDRIAKKFEETLVVYEKDLKSGNWDRLLYLDGYIISFFRGFFYCYCAAHNSFSALPKVARVPDSLFVDIPPSIISDRRVQIWRDNPDHVVKLRIATKELLFQMKDWQQKVLNQTEIDPRLDKSRNFRETYELFLRLYFNLPPASVQRKKIF